MLVACRTSHPLTIDVTMHTGSQMHGIVLAKRLQTEIYIRIDICWLICQIQPILIPMNLLSLVISLYVICLAQAVPLPSFFKRLYSPSSPVFSVIAHHQGAVFQYNLLKWDGKDLVLNADEQAFFGRVRASEGYILNLPGSNKTANATQGIANTYNVHVNPKTNKLSTTLEAANSTQGFGIIQQKLSYKNSTEFLACPDGSYRDVYHVYWGNNNKTVCPRRANGYNIELIVQVDATVNYTPQTNVQNNTTIANGTILSNTTTSAPLGLPPIQNKKRRFILF